MADALELAAQLAAADPRTRDVALYRAAEDVLRSLETHYGPPEPPKLLDGLRGRTFESLREACSAPNSAYARQFGIFRNAVLLHEEQCAQRLDVLRSTAQLLTRLREGAREPQRLTAMLEQLASFVAQRWRLDLPLDDVPGHRGWSLRVSRRYDLLPPTWRSL